MHRRFVLLAALLLCGVSGLANWAPRAHAQLESLSSKFSGGGSADAQDSAKLTLKAVIEPAEGQRPARLVITGQIAPGWHTYSITQAPNGPIRSKIKLPPSSDYRLLGDFTVSPAAEIHEYADIWPGLKVEEHSGKVTWQAPIEFAAGVDPARLEIAGSVYAQLCAESCLPPHDYKFVATAGPGTGRAASAGSSRTVSASKSTPPPSPAPAVTPVPSSPKASGSATNPGEPPAGSEVLRTAHVSIRGRIEPGVVAPGGKARLMLTATPAEPWYLYALADYDSDEPGNPKPTLVELESNPPITFGRPVASTEPATKMFETHLIRYHGREVSWSVPISIPADTRPGDYPIAGLIGFMSCKDGSCDPPTAAQFSGTLRVAHGPQTAVPLQFVPAKYDQVRRLGATRLSAAMAPGAGSAATEPAALREYEVIEVNGVRATSLPMILVFSFLGGLILNVMPCVLPVIGLKILSFVEQGGHSPRRILMLNLIYSAGMILVFLVLATLAVTLNLSWGQHFNSVPFTITLAALVFAMALSFLGVWEIPIPGFVGSGVTAEVASREGAAGAFAKGIVTTVLATPCSGPYLGAVFGFTVGQPPAITYLVFATIGLGMASPYLVIGAFPRLIRFLPKPGAWMDTFKQMMGFVLLGTVVFLFTALNRDYFVPTFALLVGIWAACWWIGRMPFTLSPGRRLLGWLEGAVVTAVVGSFAFTWLVPHPNVLPWQPFSRTALSQLTGQGKTVLVDFTANWCLTCQLNLKNAIETEAVRKRIETNGVVPLLADWSNQEASSDEIQPMLRDLNSNDIPLLAIFPADRPGKVYVLRAIISQRQLLDALAEAGPSSPASAQASAADQPRAAEPGGTRR
ncbi:MAG TPA: thioredoxin family protein [Pirellulales bacterium]|jgi:thiol:disulfide interchange protein